MPVTTETSPDDRPPPRLPGRQQRLTSYDHDARLPPSSNRLLLVPARGTGLPPVFEGRPDPDGDDPRSSDAPTAPEAFAQILLVLTLREIITYIAREISHPLTAVINNATDCSRFVLAEGPSSAAISMARLDAILATLSDIACESRRAGDVVGTMLACLDHGRSPQSPVDASPVVGAAIGIAEPALQRHGVVVRLALDPGLPPVGIDGLKLQAVLHHLIANAIEAMHDVPRDTRTLTVRARLERTGQVAISIEDNGPGFDASDRTQVFDMFYTTKPGHAGLGLWLSRSILRSAGGNIKLTREALAAPTIVRLVLPVAA